MANHLKSCLGLHLHAEQPGCERLRWLPDTQRGDRVRVLENTCDWADPVSYELCAAGGMRFIRRTDWRTFPAGVHETERFSADRAGQIWARLVEGEAR